MGSALTVVIAFFFVIVAIVLAGEVQTGVIDSINSTATYSVVREQITPVLNFNTTLDHPNVRNSTVTLTFALGIAGNIPNSGFHLTQNLGRLQILNTTANNTLLNISYDYTETEQNAEYNISNNGLTGVLNISSRTSLLGTIVMVVLVIGILTSFFLVRGAGGGI